MKTSPGSRQPGGSIAVACSEDQVLRRGGHTLAGHLSISGAVAAYDATTSQYAGFDSRQFSANSRDRRHELTPQKYTAARKQTVPELRMQGGTVRNVCGATLPWPDYFLNSPLFLQIRT